MPPLPGGAGVSFASAPAAAVVPAGAGVVAGVVAGFGGVWASGPAADAGWTAHMARTRPASPRRSERMAQQPIPSRRSGRSSRVESPADELHDRRTEPRAPAAAGRPAEPAHA